MPDVVTTRRLLALFMLVLLLMPASSSAQGVSPFGDATPASGGAASDTPGGEGWVIAAARDIEVDGMPLVLSPDGQWIAGIGPDQQICAWAIASLTPTCADSGEYRPNQEAIVWSPDSTAVAFTEDAARLLIDSDLHVFEVEQGTLTNLTDDGVTGGLPFDESDRETPITVDLGPTWAADSQSLMTGRMFWTAEGDERPSQIIAVPRSGGDATVLATFDTGDPWGVIFPMIALDDGTLVFTLFSGGANSAHDGIWIMAPGSEPELVLPGTPDDEFPMPRVIDAASSADGVIVSAFSMPLAARSFGQESYAFLLNADTGELDVLPPGVGPARFGPDGQSMVSLAVEENEGMLQLSGPTGDVSSLGPVPRSRTELFQGLEWAANDTIWINSGVESGVLVSLAPTGP